VISGPLNLPCCLRLCPDALRHLLSIVAPFLALIPAFEQALSSQFLYFPLSPLSSLLESWDEGEEGGDKGK